MTISRKLFRMKKVRISLSFFMMLCFVNVTSQVHAGEVHLSNGDVINGNVTQETETSITIESATFGNITVKKADITKLIAPELGKDPVWKGKVGAGYSATTGVTETHDIYLLAEADKKYDNGNEWNLRADYFLSKNGDETTKKDAGASVRYAYTFWEPEEKPTNDNFVDLFKAERIQNYYKLSIEHDELADIEYRILGETGFSYWMDDRDDWKARFDLGLGYSYTSYLAGPDSDSSELLVIPSLYLEKTFSSAVLSEHLTWYPVVGAFQDYRLVSVTKLSTPLSNSFGLDLALINEYDNSGRVKDKNELKFISALTYAF